MAVAAAVAAVAAVADVVIDMFCNNHSRLLLQFHITGKCNLRCRHCYRTEGDVERLSFEDVVQIIEQFKELREEYNRVHRISKKGHINITGGEPFYREDIKEILEYLGENKRYFSYGILTNGSFIDDKIIAILRKTGVSFVQMSIDGDEKTHDFLRADGDYERVLNTAEYLEKSGIKTYISFTANKENYKFLPKVAKECRKRKITKLWSDRLVPIGNGSEMQDLAITKAEMPEYIKYMKKAQGNFLIRKLYPKTQVTMNRALQFQNSRGNIYSCSAANSLITVDEFGNVMPCRRMPIVCGNAFELTLRDIYFNNETFKELRKNIIAKECSQCKYSYFCGGGARCQSYAKYGLYYRADPACPICK